MYASVCACVSVCAACVWVECVRVIVCVCVCVCGLCDVSVLYVPVLMCGPFVCCMRVWLVYWMCVSVFGGMCVLVV